MTTTTLRVLPAPRHTPVGIPLPTHDQGRDEQLAQPTPYVQDALAVDFAAADLQHAPGVSQVYAAAWSQAHRDHELDKLFNVDFYDAQ